MRRGVYPRRFEGPRSSKKTGLEKAESIGNDLVAQTQLLKLKIEKVLDSQKEPHKSVSWVCWTSYSTQKPLPKITRF